MALSRSLSIRTRLTLLAGTSVAGLAIFGALAWRAIETVKVGGPHYRAIVQSKDLIADVLPPPAYIIEAYLTAYEIVEAPAGSTQSRAPIDSPRRFAAYSPIPDPRAVCVSRRA